MVPHRGQRWALKSLDNFTAETLIHCVGQVNDGNWAYSVEKVPLAMGVKS